MIRFRSNRWSTPFPCLAVTPSHKAQSPHGFSLTQSVPCAILLLKSTMPAPTLPCVLSSKRFNRLLLLSLLLLLLFLRLCLCQRWRPLRSLRRLQRTRFSTASRCAKFARQSARLSPTCWLSRLLNRMTSFVAMSGQIALWKRCDGSLVSSPTIASAMVAHGRSSCPMV